MKVPSTNGGEDRSKWLFGFLGGLIGGIGAVAVAVALTPYLRGTTGAVTAGGAAGLVAAVFGGLAALLAVGIAVVVAIQWIFLDSRVNMAITRQSKKIARAMDAKVSSAVRGMGEFVLAWLGLETESQDDSGIKKALQHYPRIPNAAALTAMHFIILAHDYKSGAMRINSTGNAPLSPDVKRQVAEMATNKAEYWADEALRSADSHDPGYPEYVKACVLSLRKEPTSAISYLDRAFNKDHGHMQAAIESEKFWDIIFGMTHGEQDMRLIKRLISLFQLKLPTSLEIWHHAENRDQMQRAEYDAIRKSTGDSETIAIEGIPSAKKWSIEGPTIYDRDESDNIDEALAHLSGKYIITRIKPHRSYFALRVGRQDADEQI
ncbi:MAG: hypothetical protein M0031_10450 [Thermaerobacter sp.]|nr:hypothetical protein [Thermaerobacter sp.]